MTPSSPSQSAGELFDDRYELVQLLGSGWFGEVWEAVDRRLGRTVALKILKRNDEQAAWREGSRLTSLKSPNILPVHNAGLAVDVPYLDTELAQQGTAKSAAEPYGLEPSRAVRLARDVLRGLELCHKRRVLHMDVKPANVFLTATDDARLGDFGTAAIMDDQGTAKAEGDPDVRPPEVLMGGRHDVSADVYAAGLTLYALLTGALPHSIAVAGSFAQHKANVLAGMPALRELAPHVNRSLAGVVKKATETKAEDRYVTAADLDAALGALPQPTWTYQQVAPHAGHERCWDAQRVHDHHPVDVCVIPGKATGFGVEVRHRESRNRIRDLCGAAVSERALRVLLRGTFEELRKL